MPFVRGRGGVTDGNRAMKLRAQRESESISSIQEARIKDLHQWLDKLRSSNVISRKDLRSFTGNAVTLLAHCIPDGHF